MLDKLPK